MSPRAGGVSVRFATADDCALILDFIRELALYEKAPDAVVATEAQLREHGFGAQPQFEALIAELDGAPVGMALFHPRFSTWLGRPTMYLEDIVVRAAARGHGVGRRLMARLATIALDRGWGRIDFTVLDWNPARGFYRKLGFDHLDEWLRYGAGEGWLRRLAEWDKAE
ncbi:MAG: GNAT family N-acetyltransferase [Alphaproteobacteria bacterium]|nr:GNAT family N-acetyltransferase [Alphaproteobacteria bacterium]